MVIGYEQLWRHVDIDGMNESEVAIRLGVADLMARYQRLADSGRLEELSELFTEESVLQTNTQRHLGRRQVLQFFRDTADAWAGSQCLPARHHLSSILVEPGPDGTASTYACFQWVGTRGLDHWGTYRDKVVLFDGQWRFAVRKVFVEGHVADSPAVALLGLSADHDDDVR